MRHCVSCHQSVGEMCGPGFGPDKTSLLNKKERIELYNCANMCELIDFMDEKMNAANLPDDRPPGGVLRKEYI